MTTDRMIAALEEVYCETYPRTLRVILAEYLDAFDDRLRDSLFRVVLLRYSRQYGKAPGVSVFEDGLEEAQGALTSDTPAIAYDDVPSEEDKAELGRLIEEARKTRVGRFLLKHVNLGKEAS